MRQDFTANVSHELKTPLTAISGYAELMENGMVPPEEIGSFAQKIEKNARRLLSLINDIIRLSELDSSNTQLLVEKFDLFEEAQICVENMQIYAEKNDVTITYEGGHQEITANREMINELINNLCANAIRYNKKNGSVKVRVDSSQGHPYISVADTGIGISKEHQKRVFERFYRVDKSRSKQTGGTGLGLAIVKHIVALHDAQLNLESEVDVYKRQVYGLFGMLFFVTALKWKFSILAGAFTLAIMILPVILRTTEEALLSVPDSYREGSFGLGAGKLRTIFKIVLPAAVPGILSGVILATGRIVGETAALIYTAGTVAKIPNSAFSSGRTLAVHMYLLANEGLHVNQAYATAVILLILVIGINALSSFIAVSYTHLDVYKRQALAVTCISM